MLRHMEPPDFHVVVVRAWREADVLRIRVLADGGSGRQWVVGSISGACEVLGSLLAELLVAPTRSSTAEPPQTPPSRRVDDAMSRVGFGPLEVAMAVHDMSVKPAVESTQDDLLRDREHCSVDSRLLAAIGCTLGQQVRIRRSGVEYGLYTVSEVRDEGPDDLVRMGLTGRRRLDTDHGFDGEVDSQVASPALTVAAAELASEFIERLDDDGRQSALIAIAPHGGDIEQHTDQQAERVASRLGGNAVSSWRCKGWKAGGGAHARWHITSTDIDEGSFPLLDSVISRDFTHAVAFHGFDDEVGVLVGGAAPDALKCEIAEGIQGALGPEIVVRVAEPAEPFGGADARNIVNRLTAGGMNGIQIEQSPEVRSRHWCAIADAVADVYRGKLQNGS